MVSFVLDKAAILAANDIKTEIVKIPEWKGEVRVAMMSAADRDIYETALFKAKGDFKNVRALMCSLVLVDDNCEKLFTADEVETLGKKNYKALDRIVDAANRLNALDAEAIEVAKKN